MSLRKSPRICGWAWVLYKRKDYFWKKKKNSKFQQNRVLHPSVDEFLHLHCGVHEKRPERTTKPSAKLQTVIAGGDTQDYVDCRLVRVIESPQLQHLPKEQAASSCKTCLRTNRKCIFLKSGVENVSFITDFWILSRFLRKSKQLNMPHSLYISR